MFRVFSRHAPSAPPPAVIEKTAPGSKVSEFCRTWLADARTEPASETSPAPSIDERLKFVPEISLNVPSTVDGPPTCNAAPAGNDAVIVEPAEMPSPPADNAPFA